LLAQIEEDDEDVRIADERLAAIERGEEETVSIEEAAKELGLA